MRDSRFGDPIDLVLLDGFRLVHNGVPVMAALGCQRLLALLAIRGSMTRSVAAGILWPDSTEGRALASLRTALWQLGKLPFSTVAAGRDRLGLRPVVAVDVRAVAQWAARIAGDDQLADEDLDFANAGSGELLPGWYEDWVAFERERLRLLRLHALESLALHLGRRGRYSEAIQVALETIRLDPLRESAHRVLISVHLSEGNVVEAMRDFRTIRNLLRAELGVEPSPGLRALLVASGLGSP